MRIGSKTWYPLERLWTARALVRLGAAEEQPGEAPARAQRVDALRRQIEAGTYHIDAEAVARAMLLEIAAGAT